MFINQEDINGLLARVRAMEGDQAIAHFEPFVAEMHAKLVVNKHKIGSPKGQLDVEALLAYLKIEIAEFELALAWLPHEEALKEIVDVANFCMLIHKRITETHDQ